MRLQVRTQLVLGRLGLSSKVFGNELQLLPQPAADDGVVLVQTERDGFARADFLPDVVANQSIQLLDRRRTLPGAVERRGERLDAALRDDNPLLCATRWHRAVGCKDDRTEQQEMQERLFEKGLHLTSPANTRSASSTRVPVWSSGPRATSLDRITTNNRSPAGPTFALPSPSRRRGPSTRS